jgi:hypothetical protein
VPQWTHVGRDSIAVQWNPGVEIDAIAIGGESEFRLAVITDTLRGRISIFPDAGTPFVVARATVMGLRTPCDTSERTVSEARAPELRSWSNAQVPDTALWNHLVAKEWRELKRQNSGMGPTYLSTMLRDYYSIHQRLPTSLESMFPLEDPVLHAFSPTIFLQDGWGTPYRYTARGAVYDLRSAGRDRRFGTADDGAWLAYSAAPRNIQH